jgi:hypothetical protein
MKRDRLLRRAQLGTLILGAVVGGGLFALGKPQLAQGLAVGSLWAAINLRITESLLRAMVVPRDRTRDSWSVAIWFLLKMSVYVLAVWLLIVAPFPVVGMAHGLTVMLTALVIAGVTTRSAPQSNVSRRGDDAHA